MNALARRCAPHVAPSTIAAVAQTESGFQPFEVHDNTTGRSAAVQTASEAVSITTRLIAAGHSVDLGLMQINSANLAPLDLSIPGAFDACRSIGAGAAILAADYTGGDTHAAQQAALRAALSRYNTGNPEAGFANGYVHRVELSAVRNVPALDVGAPSGTVAPLPAAKSPPKPTDPNAPPSWDVWRSADYAASHEEATAIVLPGARSDSPSF